jgi:Ca2+-binding RTX toxin-like protein
LAIPKPNIATAAKAKTTSAAVNAKVLAAAAKESPLINPNQVQNQGTDYSSQSNKPRPGFEGPPPAIPEVSKPGYTPATAASQQATLNNALGLVSKTDARKHLAGVGTSSTAAQSEKDKLKDLSGSSTTNQPSSDQGFGSQPNVDANTVPGGNPMAAFQGQNIGGVLGAAAASSQPAPTPGSGGAVGSGLVSAWYHVDWAIDAAGWISDFAWDLQHNSQTTTAGSKSNKSPDNPTGSPDNIKTPNPENTGSNVNILSQSMLDQLNAAKAGKPTRQGGSGDATPVDDGGIPQVVNNGSIAVNQGVIDSRNLFGQPGGSAIGENVSGGNKGLDVFGKSNGAGVTNPGGEGGIPSGDPHFLQDPANAMPGNKPAPTLQSPVGTQENQSSSVSTTLAAGARNLTLAGTAAINGSGNALDNVINGNGAANELRGDAGNDRLDGGAGRDVLTGGSGADRFRFATAGAFGQAQADHITDFSRSEGDRIELSRNAFGLSAGAAVSFQSVNNDAELTRALGSSSLLVQDLRDGSILFNQNGSTAGVGQGGVFAVVSQGLTLQASDFALGA